MAAQDSGLSLMSMIALFTPSNSLCGLYLVVVLGSVDVEVRFGVDGSQLDARIVEQSVTFFEILAEPRCRHVPAVPARDRLAVDSACTYHKLKFHGSSFLVASS